MTKKVIYALILPVVVAGGLVFANREMKKENSVKPVSKPPTPAEMEAERKKWEATPEGIRYKQWEASDAGKKVLSGAAKIIKHTRDSSNMEAVVTSLSLPPGSRLGFGVMVRINDEDYILSFGLGKPGEFDQLQGLRVNDKIILKSGNVSYAPKYAYPIVRGDYVEQGGKQLYKRPPFKGGC